MSEYCAIVWDRHTVCDKSQVEQVQRTFLDFAAFTLKIEHPLNDYHPVLTCIT